MSAEIQAITMPKWGLAMEEGKVVAWETGEGEAVAAGQEILEIETTKITNVFESPASGLLRRCVVQEGDTVPVGALLGALARKLTHTAGTARATVHTARSARATRPASHATRPASHATGPAGRTAGTAARRTAGCAATARCTAGR